MSVNKLDKYDVIVVGAGNAALSSAIAAKENGANVLVVEKAPQHQMGGNSYFTDGAIRFAYKDKKELSQIIPELNDDADRIQVPTYADEDFLNDLEEVTNGQTDPKLANHLVSKSFETIQWMKSHGVEFEMNPNQMFEENGVKQFWGGLPVQTKNKGIGLIETLLKKAESMGVEIIYDTRAVAIQTEAEEISGLIVEKAGSEKTTIATKAIILACGGFEANKEMRIKYLGKEWENAVVRGTEYNTGDGIKMAVRVGAKTRGQWDGCHAHTTDYNAPKVGDFSKPGDIYKKSSYPLGLIVNKEGKRFVDEGADFRNYTYAKYGKETLKQTDQLAYQLFDSQVYSLLRKEYLLEEATCIKGASIESLSSKMEIDAEQFKKTIEKFNAAVQEGLYSPSVKDGKGTEGITPPKSNWALTFEEGPFYAYPVTCGITFTFGALHVDETGQVLNQDEIPIHGLFASGEMVGGLFYHNYPGGSGLMSGSVFGKTSGESAAKYIKELN